jgi:HAD superfamily hydrolase (TIGR01509 family)
MTPPASSGRRFEAVIFDLDGVLVDSEIWWDDVRADLAHRNGRDWSEDDRVAVMGQNSRQWSATMRARLDLATPAEVIEREVVDGVVERYRSEGPPVIPGAADVVRRVGSRLRTAVASSAHREVIDAALAALGLEDDFDVVVSSDEVPRGKPDPDVYLEAARRLGVAPSACLVVEDSCNGVLAARAAGMTVVLVPNASIPPAPGTREAASVVRDRLVDIVELLDLPTGAGRVAPRAS